MQSKRKFAAKATSMIMACTLAVSAFGTPSFGSVSAAEMTADQITEEMGLGWNIGNSLDATPSTSDVTKHETAWGNPVVTQELIDAVKAKGFNTIRVPITWYPHVTEENGTYTIDPAWLARVKEVVDYAYNQDMYVILNVHHENWINRSDFTTAYDEMSAKLTQIWEQIATYFKDYDQHLIFEGMNEPRAVDTDYEWGWGVPQEGYDVVNKLCSDFVNTVRSVDSPYQDTRLLMIPGYCASHELHVISQIDFPENDAYVAASVHAYSPYEFAMGDGDHTTFSETYEASLDTIFKNIQSTLTDKDIPVVIGEFGTSDYDNTEARIDWAKYYLTWTKKLGIPCVLWDNDAVGNSDKSECHTYINRDTYEWYENGGAVVDAMVSVMNDSSVVWDSEEHKPSYEHADLSTGDVIWEGSNSITGSSTGVSITPEQVAKGEIAVKYTGTTPVLAFMNSSWGNWTEVGSYDVDEENGIAYYDSDDIARAWGEDVSSIASICLKVTSGECAYTLITALGEASVSTGTTPVETTTATTKATTTATTETTVSQTTEATTTATTDSGEQPSAGKSYTQELGEMYSYSELPEDGRMIGWTYESFGIGADEKVTRVEVNISSIASSIGKWQGAFGSSTTVDPDYWTQTDQMEQTFDSKTGTIVWEVDAATSEIIQTQYGGEVKFGIWWIDCDTFIIDSVTIYTDGEGGTVTTAKPDETETTTTTTTTTAKPVESTTSATTTKGGSETEGGVYTKEIGDLYSYSELPEDGRMIGFAYEDFGIGADEKVTRVEITISSIASKIGKWQGAFGSSTTVDPDYWTQTDQMEQTFDSKTGTIVWEVDAATSEIIQTQYGGEVKFGIWWIDCDTFTIDSVAIYTDGAGSDVSQSSATTTSTTQTTTTTTKTTTSATVTTTAKTTTATTTTNAPATSTQAPATTSTTESTTKTPVEVTVGDVNMDGKVSIKDIILLNKAVVGIINLNADQQKAAECCTDGTLDVNDVTALMKYVVELVSALPVTEV